MVVANSAKNARLIASATPAVAFFGTQTANIYLANSLLNSYSNAFNIPAAYSVELSVLTNGLSDKLASNGIGLFPSMSCYDPSTRTTISCSSNDFECLVSCLSKRP